MLRYLTALIYSVHLVTALTGCADDKEAVAKAMSAQGHSAVDNSLVYITVDPGRPFAYFKTSLDGAAIDQPANLKCKLNPGARIKAKILAPHPKALEFLHIYSFGVADKKDLAGEGTACADEKKPLEGYIFKVHLKDENPYPPAPAVASAPAQAPDAAAAPAQ